MDQPSLAETAQNEADTSQAIAESTAIRGTITTVSPSTMVSPTITTYPTITVSPTIMAGPTIMAHPTITVDLTTLMNSKPFMTMPPPTIPPTPITPTTPTTTVRPTIKVELTISHPLPWPLLMALSSPNIPLVRAPLMVSTTMVGPTTTVSPTTKGVPTTTVSPTITVRPTTMRGPTITVSPTTMRGPTTMVSPTTIGGPITTVSPTTMGGPITTVRPTTMVGLTTIGNPITTVGLTTMVRFPTIVGSITKVSLTTIKIPTRMVALTITVRPITMVGTIIMKPTTTEGLFIMERPFPTIPMWTPTTIARYLTSMTTTATTVNTTMATMVTTASTTMAITGSTATASTTIVCIVMIISMVITATGIALQPSMVRVQHSAFSLTRSHSAVRSHVSLRSNKVHPQDSSSKTSSESWAEEDEQFQKRKTARAQRAHKRLHTVDLFYRLWEKLSYLIKGLRRMLRNLTQSLPFEAFIFLVVCLNTIMLVAQTFAEVEIRGEWYFMALDSIFLCIYVVEAALKITALGFEYFSDPWNNLDFFIMIMAMLDFMLLQYNSFSFVYHQSVFRIFKVFKSLRALRAVRVLRRLSFLTSLQEVTGTLARSLPSITAILILMFTCLFLFSVVLRALFRHSDPKRFQSIPSTIFTLFTMLTLDDWSLIYLDSRAQGAWYIIPILMIYIIIQYFIFLNLVIAVLVDNFQMALLKGLEKVKQERAARIHEKLLDDSLTELSKSDPEEVVSEHTKQKQLIEKKFGTMTEKQQELLFHFLQLVASVEHHQQKFRSQASVLDEIVDTAFEAGEEDFRK
ncbi:cation channel sperm-associated protein 1 [Eumetopias jubatus]|uniref:cation channel sperm-associated protein 1 n=1 Tax=Eumetopias jubatus TaxID=34886 RepID=UPI001016859F|nr:cation channel sperm-associated protein 1 [Eumetopias jubatus]